MNLAEMLAKADQETQGVEVNTEFELIEPGVYTVAVTGAEGPVESSRVNPNNIQEHGQYIRIECTITGPKNAGRKVWMNNNILVYPKDNTADATKKAQTAMAMGAKERKVMLDSVGKTGIENATELVGAQFSATIAIEKGTNGYKDKNVIKTVKPCGGASATTPPSVTPAPSEPTATPRKKMPWEK